MRRLKQITTAAAFAWAGALCAQQVSNAEYFWDTDPGAGNGIGMVAQDGAYDQAMETIFMGTATLPGLGAHTLGIRVQDQNNTWGPTFTTVVVIEPSVVTAPEISVTQAEYFWDADPGEGNGTTMLAFDGDYNAALEAISADIASLPSTGVHVLHVRSRDANATWSAPFSIVVEVFPGAVSFPQIRVQAAEYYVNIDPGMGNATPMLAIDGDFNAAWEAIKGGGIPAPVMAGPNVLWMRAKDVNDTWGPSFGIVVNIDTTITGTVDVPELTHADDVTVFPNPVHGDHFTIASTGSLSNAMVLVVDAGGRTILRMRMNAAREMRVPLSDLAPGIYQVGIVQDAGATLWRRLVVQ
ncbi:MAG: T9SS type A sorting domain-containing protein [Flavobacteriales bacterium]